MLNMPDSSVNRSAVINLSVCHGGIDWLDKAILLCKVNPLSPHDALKHHITALKTDLIFLQ